MFKKIILVTVVMTSLSVFAKESGYLGKKDYSRAAVKSIALAYVAGSLNASVKDVKANVDEVVVNDQNGITQYDVEVMMIDGMTYVVTFELLEVVGVQ